MMEDLHIGSTLGTALGLDRSWSALDLLIGDGLGRSTYAAFCADVVPQRAAQRTGAEARSTPAFPVHHQRRCRWPAAGRTCAVRDRNEVLHVKLRREPRKMDLQHRRDEDVLGNG